MSSSIIASRSWASAPGRRPPTASLPLRTVMCIAACNRAPVAQVNREYRYSLTPETFDKMVDDLK